MPTKTELQQQLTDAGIEFPASANKAELTALLPNEAKTPDQLTDDALAEAEEQQEKAPEVAPKPQPKPAPGVPSKKLIKVRTAKHGTLTMTKEQYEEWRAKQNKKSD